MVDRGAGTLVLAGRGAPGEPAAAAVSRLRAAGARVETLRLEVGDGGEVEALVRRFGADWPALGGVIHAAGVLDDGVLLQQSGARLAAVLRPKVLGGWHLHRATRHLDLDFFVLFSSAAALLGAPGQGIYAAANAALDALAHLRRGQGLTALSIDWGPWAEVGMAADAARRGLARWPDGGGVSPDAALEILGRLLRAAPAAQVAVLPAGASRRRLDGQIGTAADRWPGRGSGPAPSPALAALAGAPAAERQRLLLAFLRDESAAVLRLGADAPLENGRSLFEAGLDSLMAVELKNRVQAALGRPLLSTLLFDHPTLDGLATHLAGLDGGGKTAADTAGAAGAATAAVVAGAAGAGAAGHPASRREELSQLPEAEMESRLLAKLASLERAAAGRT
jgi:aryl carrier-like protein